MIYQRVPLLTNPIPPSINQYQPILFLLEDYRLLHSLPRVLFNIPLHESAPIPFGFRTLVPAIVFCCQLWEKLTLSFWVKGRWTTYIFSIFAEQRGNVLSNERLSIRCVDYKTGDAGNEQRRTGGFSIKVSDSSVAKPQNQKNLNIYPTGRNGDKTCHKGCG